MTKDVFQKSLCFNDDEKLQYAIVIVKSNHSFLSLRQSLRLLCRWICLSMKNEREGGLQLSAF